MCCLENCNFYDDQHRDYYSKLIFKDLLRLVSMKWYFLYLQLIYSIARVHILQFNYSKSPCLANPKQISEDTFKFYVILISTINSCVIVCYTIHSCHPLSNMCTLYAMLPHVHSE